MNFIRTINPACLPVFYLLLLVFPNACTDANSRSGAHTPPHSPALDDPKLRQLVSEFDRFFADSMAGSNTPGAAVVIVKDSVVIFQRGYGVKSTKSTDAVDVHTVFRLGSLSKGFTAVLAAMLVKDSALRWEDPIIRYVPEFRLSSPEQTRQIQLSHLLSHTTGLPYHAFTDMIERGYDTRTIAARFSKLKLFGKPGERFSYQNAAFSLVGEAMQVATGKPFPALIRDKIFQPAGMRDASADWVSIRRNPDVALPHDLTAAGWIPDTITARYYNSAPAGGINASIADMGQWLILLLGHRPDIIDTAALNQVFQPVVRTYNERRYFRMWSGSREAWYGKGWRVLVNGADTIVYHGGSVNGYRGEIALDRRNGIAICALFNASTALSSACVPAFFERFRKQ